MKLNKKILVVLCSGILLTATASATGSKQKPPVPENDIKIVTIFDWFK